MTTTMQQQILKGTMTDKGLVEKIVYLTFAKGGSPTGSYSDKPIIGGKGLVCAKIGTKNIPVSELKIIEVKRLPGEAWMICTDCGGKLHSFNGAEDKSINCPYSVSGQCYPI